MYHTENRLCAGQEHGKWLRDQQSPVPQTIFAQRKCAGFAAPPVVLEEEGVAELEAGGDGCAVSGLTRGVESPRRRRPTCTSSGERGPVSSPGGGSVDTVVGREVLAWSGSGATWCKGGNGAVETGGGGMGGIGKGTRGGTPPNPMPVIC